MYDVALFPIPNAVNFPGVACPLHVFEPRYRQMVRYCLDEEMLMGVCHVEKVVHRKEREQTLEEALSSNQATYKPLRVFSAGPVQLLEELEDGRMLIRVENQLRLTLVEEKQLLPFSIWRCEELPDEALDETSLQVLEQSKAKILNRLIAITHANEDAQETLQSEHWQSMPAQTFSFAVAGLLGMPAETSQALLETTSAPQRLEMILALINSMGPGPVAS